MMRIFFCVKRILDASFIYYNAMDYLRIAKRLNGSIKSNAIVDFTHFLFYFVFT